MIFKERDFKSLLSSQRRPAFLREERRFPVGRCDGEGWWRRNSRGKQSRWQAIQLFKHLLLIITLFVTMMILGCTSSTYKNANARYHQTQQKIKVKEQKAEEMPPSVVVKSGYYVDARPISWRKRVGWLQRHITIRAESLPFSILIDRMMRDTPVNVIYDSTIQQHRLVSFNYTGSLDAALHNIAAQEDYYYSLNKGVLGWSAFETRTFNISFMPGVSNYLVGRTRNSMDQKNQYSHKGTHISRVDDQQYSNLEARLSVWRDLRKTLTDLKSKEGHVVISESTTTATVSDHPSNIRNIAKYIDQLNKNLSQEVSIRVEILDIELNKNFNFGIDWDLIVKTIVKNIPDFRLTSTLGSATNLLANNLVDRNRNSAETVLEIGNLSDVNTLIRALGEQGKLRVVTKPKVVTMNNQMASIRITQDTGYIESVNQSYAENYFTTSITPGTVTDGFTLYILPKIQGNKVYMQISSTIANLVRLDKQSTIPEGVTPHNMRNNQYNAIEVPTIAEKVFNQRSVVTSGSTLVIAGYKRLRDVTAEAKLFGASALGGKGAKIHNVETLVLITPTVLRNES